MSTRFLLSLIVVSVFSLTGFGPPQGAEKLTWYSFDEGVSKAQKENKQVLVDFYTDWCGWCKEMDKTTYSDRDVISYLNDKFVVIRLNPEKDGTLKFGDKQFKNMEFSLGVGVNGYPATLFMESDYEILQLVPGYMPAETFMYYIGFFGDRWYEKGGQTAYDAARTQNKTQ